MAEANRMSTFTTVLVFIFTLWMGQGKGEGLPRLQRSLPHATMCHDCDDNVPGHECSSSTKMMICKNETPYCLSTIKGDNRGMVVSKGCASENVCHDLWWHQTKPNPSCNEHAVTSGHVTPGETCNFCCKAAGVSVVYCNRNTYPHDLVTFSDTPKAPTTSKPTTTQKTTTIRTTASTTTSKATTLKHVYTTAHHPHQQTTMTGHSSHAKATMCLQCVEDTETGEMCDEGNSFVICGGDHNFCLTSYYSRPNGGFRMERKCGSRDECYDKWWIKTSNKQECFQDDLLTGSGSKPAECHFCCTTRSGNVNDYCSKHKYQLIPKNLAIFSYTVTASSSPTGSPPSSAGTSREITTTTQLKTTTSRPTQTVLPQTGPVCEVCEDNGKGIISCKDTHCESYTPYCLNSVTTHGDGTKTVTKSCASETKCFRDWWMHSKTNPKCRNGTLQTIPEYSFCAYCCDSGSTGVACNKDDVPNDLWAPIWATPSPTTVIHTHSVSRETTTATTVSSTAAPHKDTTRPSSVVQTSTSPHESTVTRTTVTASAAGWCLECEDDPVSGKKCTDQDLVRCADYEPYCMNTVETAASGLRRTTRRCVSDVECYNSWWQQTKPNDACMLGNMATLNLGGHGLMCSYCCNSSGSQDPCNKDTRPLSLVLYTNPQTTQATTAKPHHHHTHKPHKTHTPSPSHHEDQTTTPVTSTIQITTDQTTLAPIKSTTGETTTAATSRETTTAATSATTDTSTTQKSTTEKTSPSVPVTTVEATTTTLLTKTSAKLQPTTDTSTETTSTLKTVPTTTEKSSIQASVGDCYECTAGCPFLQKSKPCASGLCMSSIIDDNQFTRTILKSCVSEGECYNKWWLQTSDTDLCLSMMSMPGMPSGMDIECHYCCKGNNCNQGVFPSIDSLYDGARHKGR